MKPLFSYHKLLVLVFLSTSGFIALSFMKPIVEPEILSLNVSLDNAYYTADRKELYLYIDVKAGKAKEKKERTSLNLSLVLDRSGSMQGDKIKYARDACKFVADNLEPNDILSLVIYDDQVNVLSASAPVKDKLKLRKLIDGISDRGSTNLSGGMLEGYNQVHTTLDKKRVNRVLLLSDGLANQGITDAKILQQLAREKNQTEGMTLSTFGVGADFNELLMTGLAEYGSGNYYFIDSPDKIPAIFAKELQGLLSVVAQNSKLSIRFPSRYLSISKTFGYTGQVKGDEISFDLKDVFSEEQKAILIKFSVKEPLPSETVFETNLSYDDATTFRHVNLTEKTKLKSVTDKTVFDKGFNKDVLQQIVLFENNERLEDAMTEVDNGNYEKAKVIIIQIKKDMTGQMKNLPDSADLSKQFVIVSEYEKQIENAEKMGASEKSMMQKANRNSNYIIRKKK